jgi:lipopolysaccharide/colanic/teichoic acid biosynthesis glycosyltransferase
MKRTFDLFFSALALITLAPFFLLIAIAVKAGDRGPVFFTQERVGKDFRPFKLYKFRTMTPDAPNKGLSITSGKDPRITRVGRLLRGTKLDETGQFWNVLKGQMSIVGPRPEVARYVEMFRDDYKEILRVKPGITDFAAIEFRDEESVLAKFDNPEEGYIKEVLPRKISLYKKYLKERSFLTDMKLILLTLWRLLR